MANTAADIQKLYIAYFNRPADPAGLAYWTASSMTITQIANSFAEQTEYKAAFAGQTTEQIISTLYTNLFGSARVPDAAGLLYWVGQVNQGKSTLGNVAINILNGAQGDDKIAVDAKLAAATSFTTAIDTSAEIVAYSKANGVALAKTWLNGVTNPATATAAIATQDATISAIVEGSATGVVLTNGTDNVNGSIFEAGLVYNPAGTDRINALQSEDTLTGTGTTGKNTLNATLGNANDNGSTSITPTLKNIQIVNVNATGDTNTLDVRFADSINTLALNKVTAEAGSNFTFDNIGQVAANLAVKNSSKVGNTVSFNFSDAVLAKSNAAGTAAGGDTVNVEISAVKLDALNIGNTSNTEGYETVNLKSTGSNTVKNLHTVDMETLTITGAGNLVLANNTQQLEYVQVNTGGVTIGNGIGVRSIDSSEFVGDVNINVTAALGQHNDPGNSGAAYRANIKTGAGNDTIWTTTTVTASSSSVKDVIDGGAGNNTLRTFSAGVGSSSTLIPTIKNIQTLELRGNGSTAYMNAFDAALTKVILRDENTGNAAQTFTLNKVGATLANSGNIELHHSVTNTATAGATTFNGDTVKVSLTDASGTDDKVAITVVNDLNTTTTYNYIVDTDSANATGKVESITINDNDTESNNVTLASVADHKTGVTLTGGTAGLNYKVAGTIIAKTLDASTQKSNLTLTVGKADQTIKLGSGNDLLTFDGLDTFTGADKLSDEGGTDTMRAAFSKDVVGAPTLAGIEKLQIVANANTAIDLANATGITELALLSDKAVNVANEIFTAPVTGVETTDIFTLSNTNLTALNFFGDLDGNGTVSTSPVQTFNGVTLVNNASATLAVKIQSPLANGTDTTGANDGATAYNIGQLTTHGVTDMTITVSNENEDGATTTISNIWDRDLVNLTLAADHDINVGTVTGNTVNSNIKTFDASAVGGNTTAVVKALGDGAVVTLAGGDDDFNALGSAGNNVVIKGGDGKNTITGTAQSDYIYTGSGNDTIHADRGNNTVKSGAGNDTVDALNGSNTVDLGSGWADHVTFKYESVALQNTATNVVAGSGTSALIEFDEDNDGVVDTSYGFAVGSGAELSVKFVGTTFDAVASTFNGRSVISGQTTAAGVTGHANYNASLSNAVIFTTAPGVGESFSGGSAADAFLDFSNGNNAYNVSTGAGNDAIVMNLASTGKHTINAGTGADRVVLADVAVKGADTLVVLEGDSTATGWDIVTNFLAGTDKLDVSTTATVGTNAHLASTTFATGVTISADANGFVTLSGGNLVGVDFSLSSVVSFLANNANTTGDVYFVSYDSNGDGAVDATDNVVVFQNLGTDIVLELVGSATNDVTAVRVTDFA